MIRRTTGLTLLELMVILALIVIMAGFVVPGIGTWKKRYDVENTIKDLYRILQDVRIKAFTEKRACGITFGSNHFSRLNIACDEDNDGDITDENGTPFALRVEVAVTGNHTYCEFSPKGFANTLMSFYVADNYDADYSCVKVSQTRIKTGKWENDACNVK